MIQYVYYTAGRGEDGSAQILQYSKKVREQLVFSTYCTLSLELERERILEGLYNNGGGIVFLCIYSNLLYRSSLLYSLSIAC
jgi:hypothetical protein